MKVFALIGFLALLGYASAQCGCLKDRYYVVAARPSVSNQYVCSKHLTVIGKTVPVNDCPPATVICRGPPSYSSGGNSLPIRIQTPVASAGSAAARGTSDLTYRIVNTAPCGVNVKVAEPIGVKYDTKIEVPLPVPTAVTSTTVNLKPCVDRIVIPSPPGGCGPGVKTFREETVYVNPIQEAPVYVNPIREYEVDVNSCGSCGGNTEVVYGSSGSSCNSPVYVNSIRKVPVYVNPIRNPPVYVNPIRNPPVYVNPIRDCPIYVNPIRSCGSVATPVYKTETVHVPSGPVLDGPVKKIISRYRKSVPLLVPQVHNCSLGSTESNESFQSRSKREIPFLTHGYKFMMNMLPEFVQDPIKNTVNVFAMTHPDKRLQRVYSQPRQLSLKEKLQIQREKNLASLRNKMRERKIRNNLMKNPYFNDRGLDRQEYPRPYKFTSRSNMLEDDVRSDQHLNNGYLQSYLSNLNYNNRLDEGMYSMYSDMDFMRDMTDYKEKNIDNYLGSRKIEPRRQKLTEVERALLMMKLRKLNDKERRFKRSSAYEKYWMKKFNKSPKTKPISKLLHSSDIVLPFYHIREGSSEEKHNFNYDYEDENPWEEFLRSPLKEEPQNFRYRRQGDTFKFLEPYSYRHAASENNNMREDLLRNVIRDELKRNQYQNQEADNYVPPFGSEKKLPQSPIFNVMTFPIRLVNRFKDVTKQAFPEVGSLPKMISGTKKYFRDFGRNFRKNVLHLTSDIIGDFENLEIANAILGPARQKRSAKSSKKGKKGTKKSKKRPVKGLLRAQYEPDYSLAFGTKDKDDSKGKRRNKVKDYSKGKRRNKRYILKMVDEDEIESYLMDKLGGIFESQSETPKNVESTTTYPTQYPYYWPQHNSEEERQKKYVLQQLKPKIILDNNGRPFLEINGYKRPVLKKPNKLKKNKLKTKKSSLSKFQYYDSSEEADSEKISSLIDHAKDHVENNLKSTHSEIPIKSIKEKISQLLFETDVLVHMDFDRYDDIYDELIALQHVKTSIVQDWKRLIMSKAIDEIEAKISLLERFKELQHYKDLTLTDIVSSLSEDNENMFMVKKLIKMLVRLQKLQCLINQVVSNFHDHIHISSKSETEREIRYVDFLSGLNFALEKSRNDLISNLKKDRDVALQRNIILLDKLKKLLMYEADSDKVEEEAKLLWEMKNIEKMQKATIEDLTQKLNAGYKVKKELKILFDLLKRYETCELNQRKLLSEFEKESDESDEDEGEDSYELVGKKTSKNKKDVVLKKKLDLEELKANWEERLKKRKMLLKKKLKRNNRRLRKKSEESDGDEDD